MYELIMVSTAQQGNREAFNTLVRQYTPQLLAAARALTGRLDDAEDAVQETWVRAWQRLECLRDPAKLRPWLFTILRHACLDIRARRGEYLPLDDVDCTAAPLPDHAEMLAALERVPVPQRELLVARYVQEMSYEEMAAVFGANPLAMRVRVHRARAVLREQLQRDEEEARRLLQGALGAACLDIPLNEFADQIITEVATMSHAQTASLTAASLAPVAGGIAVPVAAKIAVAAILALGLGWAGITQIPRQLPPGTPTPLAAAQPVVEMETFTLPTGSEASPNISVKSNTIRRAEGSETTVFTGDVRLTHPYFTLACEELRWNHAEQIIETSGETTITLLPPQGATHVMIGPTTPSLIKPMRLPLTPGTPSTLKARQVRVIMRGGLMLELYDPDYGAELLRLFSYHGNKRIDVSSWTGEPITPPLPDTRRAVLQPVAGKWKISATQMEQDSGGVTMMREANITHALFSATGPRMRMVKENGIVTIDLLAPATITLHPPPGATALSVILPNDRRQAIPVTTGQDIIVTAGGGVLQMNALRFDLTGQVTLRLPDGPMPLGEQARLDLEPWRKLTATPNP